MEPKQTQVNIDILKQFSPMDQLSQKHLQELSSKSCITAFPAKKMLFKRGGQDEYTYFLLKGSVDLLDDSFQVTRVTSDSEPGKTALDNKTPFELTAVTTSAVQLLKVNRDHLDLVITWSQAGDYLVEELDDEMAQTQDWMSLLLQSSLLHKIPPSHIQQLFSAFNPKSAVEGDIIIKQGEPGDEFFVLEQGRAKVTKTNTDGTESTLATLAPGDFFGEEALISDTVRNANISMLSDGALMVLDKDTFKRLLKDPVIEYMTQSEYEDLKFKKSQIQLIDIRLSSEHKGDEVPESIHLPFLELREKMSALESNITYVVHYNGGRRSELAAYLMNEAGLNAVILKESKARNQRKAG